MKPPRRNEWLRVPRREGWYAETLEGRWTLRPERGLWVLMLNGVTQYRDLKPHKLLRMVAAKEPQ